MPGELKDIRSDLMDRMRALQERYDKLMAERDHLLEVIGYVSEDMKSLRRLLQAEEERFGRQLPMPVTSAAKAPSRFAGMGLRDALMLLRKEKPDLIKAEAKKTLLKEGFNFGGKKPGPAVHMAWVNIERKKKSRATQS